MAPAKNFSKSIIARASLILTRSERRKVLLVIVIQIGLGILDLLGVAVVGMLGALAITGVGSREPGNRVSRALELLNIQNFGLQQQATILGILAASLLILKTLISIFFIRRTTFFLSRRGAALSAKIVSKMLTQPLTTIQEKSLQQTQYALTMGVDTITMGVLNTAIILISDVSLLLILGIGLFVVDPIIAMSTAITFATVALILYKLMAQKSRMLGDIQAHLSIGTGEKIIEVLTSYRELVVRNRRSFYAKEIGELRLRTANAVAERAFMPNTSKYVIEVTIVIGSLIISAVQFSLNDAAHAVAVLSVFLAASTRIAPAVLRLQQGAITIKGSLGAAQPTLELIESLVRVAPIESSDDLVIINHSGFNPNVELRNVSMRYPGNSKYAVKGVSFSFQSGSAVAIVGPSGAGKTTLIDLLLGVLIPEEGSILIGGETPVKVVSTWPGAVGYVPQDVVIKNGTIRENISMGYPLSEASDELIWQALDVAKLKDFVETLPFGIDTHVGDRGTKISGGQRQRLGIARAMFTQPNLLVLDEATSALDGETEASITDAIQALKGKVTVVMIAHRLSTVKEADLLVYMSDGEVKSVGTFTEVRRAVKDFDHQAQLMGL